VVLALGLVAGRVRADVGDLTPEIHPAAVSALSGRTVSRIDVVAVGGKWGRDVMLRRARVGDILSPALARRAMQELADSGRYAEIRAEAVADGAGAALRLIVVPRRIVASVRIVGGALPDDETRRAIGLDAESEVTLPLLAAAGDRARAYYVRRGFPEAIVAPDAIDTDDPMRVVLVFYVTAGRTRNLSSRTFHVVPARSERIDPILDDYGLSRGDRADEDALTAADAAEQDELRKRGWPSAAVTHRLANQGAWAALTVDVAAGPFVRVRFEGNHAFDEADLDDALALDDSDDRAPGTLATRIEKYYSDRGYLDATVVPELRGAATAPLNDLVLVIREGSLVRVTSRRFPCLSGNRSPDDVGAEIDSFLSETLPGTGFAGAVDQRATDRVLGPRNTTGARVTPVEANPWKTFVPEVYDRATRHLTELYRSEGYLSATVGPATLIRRACDLRSPPGKCIPVGPLPVPAVTCPATAIDLPADDPAPVPPCVPDPRKGHRCEPDVALSIPVKLGPRAILWDLGFEGNRVLVEKELAKIADVELGEPVSQIELEKARRRILDEYAERGFAFATVELRVELSPDRTRGRARFLINEREPVRVKDIVVHGAVRTNESLILRRLAFGKGDLYRRSDVRSTEERLATLGVFSSVTVELEDPEVYAKEKVVVVTVRERSAQYLDVRPGFSTGDGVRVMFEYGHRNIGGEAVRLTLRVQLGLLPDFLIFEDDVRQRFQALPLEKRLERRDTVSIEFPEVGLGPLFPLELVGLDVRDNSRDFGLTKQAGIVTLSYRPTTRFVTQLGGSLELNDAQFLATGATLAQYQLLNPSLRVPEGTTAAVAERTNVTWDRRDDPFNATRGTFLSAGVEHVHASPVGNEAKITSDFLRLTSRVAGYVRLSDRGLALAMSFRWGYNYQLTSGSQTYPDRLFFFGGADTIRGFIQDSVIPEDLAQQIIADAKKSNTANSAILTADNVAIRGGDFMLNPRVELRIPLGGVFQTALFLDSGNVWLDPKKVDPFHLRYATGTGLRATTPVGPLAVDVGINLDRREWEDLFAFHFSIGLF
jgi:outer membrane protein assembly factor BamA